MKRTHDHTSYADTIDHDRLRASPRAIVSGWMVIAALMALAALPSMLNSAESSLIAVARAAYLDLRHSIARAPIAPTQPVVEASCS